MKKIRISDILFVIVFIVGYLVLNYPAISNIWNQYRQSLLISSYERTVQETDEATLQRLWKAAENYNETLANKGSLAYTDAFSDDEETEEDKEYENLLNLKGDGVMASIEIPKINVYLSIKHGVSDEALSDSVGHMPGSSLPVGGDTAHCLLAAHRGLPSAELFTDLDQVEEGDVFYIHVLGHTLKYEVDQITVVLPEDVSGLTLDQGKDYVTLITCTPYGVNTHRMLVRGVRVPYSEEEEDIQATPMKSLLDWILQEKILLISTAALLLLIIYMITQAVRGKNKKSKKKGKKGKKKKKNTNGKKKKPIDPKKEEEK